ncbi:MAG: methionine adenosyltransferase [Pelagibacteraceae bacterium]|nr:methionine adenosyltransferase [Pelagibacteraceae bacterium]
MFMKDYIFTSESVSEGHPDKVCDKVSDTIVDLYLSKFNESRVACETLTTTNKVILSGEIRGPSISSDEIEKEVRNTIKEIGYEQDGFHHSKLDFFNYLHEQSTDIAQGVDAAGNEKEEGAGDQGIMFGYACNETKELMPAPILYSHKILEEMAIARKSGKEKGLGPDSKSQISVIYKNRKPVGVSSVVISSQHDESLSQDDVKEIVRPYVKKVLPESWECPEDQFYVNPTGRFVIGGPDGDTGLTGRKIIVDTYGGAALHGGGAFSGKDPTKVDRSAAYISRYLAKNIVASGISDRCVIQLSYAIGVPQPLSIYIDLFNDNQNQINKIESIIRKEINLSPKGIRELLQLNKPIYKPTAAYGHFGRDPGSDGTFSWEKTDLVDLFKKV